MVARVIFDWAERTPHKIAIVQNGEPWSYRTFADAIAAARGACLVTMQNEAGEEQLIEALAPLPAEQLGTVIGTASRGFPAARIYYAERLPGNLSGKLLRDAVRALIVAVGPQP